MIIRLTDQVVCELTLHGGLQDYGWAWVPIAFTSGPVWGWDPFLPGSQHTAQACDGVAKHLAALTQQVDQAQVRG